MRGTRVQELLQRLRQYPAQGRLTEAVPHANVGPQLKTAPNKTTTFSKETVSRDEFFLMAYKVKSVLSLDVLVVFKILFAFIAKKIKCQIFTCFF